MRVAARRRACVVLLSAAVAVLVAQAGWAEPRISFKDATVIAVGITRGCSAAWLGVGHRRGDWLDYVVHFQAFASDDDDYQKEGLPPVAFL